MLPLAAPMLRSALAALCAALALAACGPTTKERGRDAIREAQALEAQGQTDAALAAYAQSIRTAGRADARTAYARLAAQRLDAQVARAAALGDAGRFTEGLRALGEIGMWIGDADALRIALARPPAYAAVETRLHQGAADDHLTRALAAFDRGDDADVLSQVTLGRGYRATEATAARLTDVGQRSRNRLATARAEAAEAHLARNDPFAALTAVADGLGYRPDGDPEARLAQLRTSANQRAAEIRLAEARASHDAPERAFDAATDGLRYTASRAVRDSLDARRLDAADRLVDARIAAATDAVGDGRIEEAVAALDGADRYAVTDGLRGRLASEAEAIGAAAIDAAFSSARAAAERGGFRDAYAALDRARPFRRGALERRYDQARGDLLLVHADVLDTAGRPDEALELLASERTAFFSDALRGRAAEIAGAARVHATDLAFVRADAFARDGRFGAADTALALAVGYGVPGQAARVDSARARVLLDRAQAALQSRRYRAAYEWAGRLDTARRPLPRGIRARQSSLRERILSDGQLRVLLLPARTADSALVATLDPLDLRLRAGRTEASAFVRFVPAVEVDRALARLRSPRALSDGDAAALARTLGASVVALVEVTATDETGGAGNTDTRGADGPPVRRIETTVRLLRANDRAELGRETTAARGQAGLDPDARHDAIATALLTRLLARLDALVP